MLNKQKQLNLLGLATKARLLVSGEETVLTEIKKKAVSLVIIATDSSEGTKKKITDKCHYYNVPYIEMFNGTDISIAIGKQRKIVAFSDEGFAKSFMVLQEK